MQNRPRARPPGDHGNLRRWLDGCRCDLCVATVDHVRAVARRNEEPFGRLPVDLYLVGAEHGTARGSRVYGCGCELCIAAARRIRPDLHPT